MKLHILSLSYLALFITNSTLSMHQLASNSTVSEKATENCSICFNRLKNKSALLGCGHNQFHKECLKKWDKKCKAAFTPCPYCKQRLAILPKLNESTITRKTIEFQGVAQSLWALIIQALISPHHPFSPTTVFRYCSYSLKALFKRRLNAINFKGSLWALDEKDLRDIAHDNYVYLPESTPIFARQRNYERTGAIIIGTKKEQKSRQLLAYYLSTHRKGSFEGATRAYSNLPALFADN